jgi:hypothetical protein
LERIGGWLALLVVRALMMRERRPDEVQRVLDGWRVEAMEALL